MEKNESLQVQICSSCSFNGYKYMSMAAHISSEVGRPHRFNDSMACKEYTIAMISVSSGQKPISPINKYNKHFSLPDRTIMKIIQNHLAKSTLETLNSGFKSVIGWQTYYVSVGKKRGEWTRQGNAGEGRHMALKVCQSRHNQLFRA